MERWVRSVLLRELSEVADFRRRRCIFLELFARRPVFQGQDEIHQLEVIFKVTGTPSVATWPTLQDLPWYELVKPKTVIESRLRETFSKCVLLHRRFVARY